MGHSQNNVYLTGWLRLKRTDVREVMLDGSRELLVQGHLLTDKAYLGGQHPVVFRGKTARLLKLMVLDQTTAAIVGVRASVEGRLLSHYARSQVEAKWITLLSPPLDENAGGPKAGPKRTPGGGLARSSAQSGTHFAPPMPFLGG